MRTLQIAPDKIRCAASRLHFGALERVVLLGDEIEVPVRHGHLHSKSRAILGAVLDMPSGWFVLEGEKGAVFSVKDSSQAIIFQDDSIAWNSIRSSERLQIPKRAHGCCAGEKRTPRNSGHILSTPV